MREMWNNGEIMGYCLRPERAFNNHAHEEHFPSYGAKFYTFFALKWQFVCTFDQRDFWSHFEGQLPPGAFFIRFSKSRPGHISASSFRGRQRGVGRWDAGNQTWESKDLDAETLLQVSCQPWLNLASSSMFIQRLRREPELYSWIITNHVYFNHTDHRQPLPHDLLKQLGQAEPSRGYPT